VINIQGSTDATQVEYVITDAQGRVIKNGLIAGASLNEQIDLTQVGARYLLRAFGYTKYTAR